MSKVIINGQEYKVPELTFNEVCRLEERGIYLLNMDPKDRKIASMLRGFVAWITDTSPEEASEILQEHIMNGGRIDDIATAVSEAFEESGFFGQGGRKASVTPMDHQKKTANKGKSRTTAT